MLKSDYFVKAQYRKTILGAFFASVCIFAGETVDSVIAGSFLGEEAITAVENATSITFITDAVALMLGFGFQILHARSIGQNDREKATGYFGNAMLASLVLGAVLAILTALISNSFLSLAGFEGQTLTDAKAYLTYAPAQAAVCCTYILAYLSVNDGDLKNMITACLSGILVNIISSCLLFNYMGLAGLGLGTFLGRIVAIMVSFLHFFGKSCSLCRMKFRFDLNAIAEILYYGLYGFAEFILSFLAGIVINRFIISRLGSGYVLPYSVVSMFQEYVLVLENVSLTGIAFAGVYTGEGNRTGVKNTLRECGKYCLLIGTAISVVFIAGSSVIPELYSITSPESLEASRVVSIIMGASGMFTAVLYTLMGMYPCLGNPGISIVFAVLFSGVFPMGLGMGLGALFGFYGMVSGVALAPLMTLLVGLGIMLLKHGKEGFPFYLDPQLRDDRTYCMDSSDPQSRRVLISLEKDLITDGVEAVQAKEIHNRLNQLTLDIFDLNGKRRVRMELSFTVQEKTVTLCLRDNGILLNEKLAAELFDRTEVQHLVTTSFNRYTFEMSRT